jgi:transcriptional regulator with XRE-family HTH domain
MQKSESTHFVSKDGLLGILRKGSKARAKFVETCLSKGVAFQIRGLRDREDWTQGQLGEKADMNQNAIYRAENPSYGKHTITTLKRIAKVFDVALVVRFVPFSQLIDWMSGTPFTDKGISPEAMSVPSFEQEASEGVFERKPASKVQSEQWDEVAALFSTNLPVNLYPTLHLYHDEAGAAWASMISQGQKSYGDAVNMVIHEIAKEGRTISIGSNMRPFMQSTSRGVGQTDLAARGLHNFKLPQGGMGRVA